VSDQFGQFAVGISIDDERSAEFVSPGLGYFDLVSPKALGAASSVWRSDEVGLFVSFVSEMCLTNRVLESDGFDLSTGRKFSAMTARLSAVGIVSNCLTGSRGFRSASVGRSDCLGLTSDTVESVQLLLNDESFRLILSVVFESLEYGWNPSRRFKSGSFSVTFESAQTSETDWLRSWLSERSNSLIGSGPDGSGLLNRSGELLVSLNWETELNWVTELGDKDSATGSPPSMLFDGSFGGVSCELRQSDDETGSRWLPSIDALVGQIGQNQGGRLRIVWTTLAAIVSVAVFIGGGIVLFLIHRRHLSEATMSDEPEEGDIELSRDCEVSLADLRNYVSGENALSSKEAELAWPGTSEQEWPESLLNRTVS
jgi:hypothetical protein